MTKSSFILRHSSSRRNSNVSLVKHKEPHTVHAVSITSCAGFPCFSASFKFGCTLTAYLRTDPVLQPQWLHNQLYMANHCLQNKFPK